MLSIMRITRRGLLGLLLTVPAFAHATGNVVGATAGQFAVQGGAATYTVPLTLPPSLGEMKPELALAYNSNGGDGPLGKGWSLSGLSAITLCPKTVAQDGAYVAASKSMAASDQRYCLDGQRLVATSGNWGTASLVMRTEIDSFSRVTIASWSGAVPTSFIVKTKAGQTLYYGANSLARSHDSVAAPNPAVAWFVNKIVDAAGNYITFAYTRPSSAAGTSPETLISRIDYTGNDSASVSPYASVHFNYQALPSVRAYYAAGYRFERSQRIGSIVTRVNGADVRQYMPVYGSLQRTGESVITSLQECAWQGSAQHCLPATTFAWNQTLTNFWAGSHATGSSWGGTEWVRTGDFNGDGLTDIASPSGGAVHLQLAKPFGGFQAVTWATASNWTTAAALLVGDFDGDGRTDFAFPSGNSVRIKYARPATNQFADVVHSFASLPWGPTVQTFVAEMNGDGLADIVSFASSVYAPTLVLTKATGAAGFNVESWARPCSLAGCASFGTDSRDNHAVDVDGDGITDFVSITATSNTNYDYANYFISNPSARTFALQLAQTVKLGQSDRRLRWLSDFDGDGLQEVGLILNNTAALYVYPPAGRGVAAFARTLPAVIPDTHKDRTWAFDYNGDGVSDIVTSPGSSITVYQATGNTSSAKSLSVSSMYWGTPVNTYLGDFNGDGLTDIGSRTTNSLIWVAQSGRNSADSPYPVETVAQPDAIAQIQSGDGALIKIDYRTMAQAIAGSTSVPSAAPVVVGETTVAAPIWLAHEVWSSHGAGPASELRGTSYQYFNLRMSTTGRGVLGFEAETVRDLLTGDWELTEYETSWPKNGLVKRKTSYLADGTPTKRLDQTSAVLGQIGAGPVYPYISASTETVFGDSGQPLIKSRTEYNNPDNYGNFAGINQLTWDDANNLTGQKLTANQYAPADTGNWILGRLTRVTVQHSTPSTTPVTKTSAFSYFGNGLLKSETVEPDAVGSSAHLHTEHSYDAFGHKASVTVSGVGHDNSARSARSTTTAVNTSTISSGYLTVTTSNAKGHAKVQHISVVHGGDLYAQDPNGVAVTTQYDAFGRKTRQTQGDVWTAWSYDAASGFNAVQSVTQTDSTGGWSAVHLDLLGRTARKDTLALDGRIITETTRYDEQGRVVEARRPAFDEYSGAPVITRYDDRGRVSEIETAGPNGGRSTTTYSYSGLTTTVTDAMSRARSETRNALGQVTSVVEGNGASSIAYEYDAVGNLVRTTDSIGQVTSIGYDVRGRKIAMLDPAMGGWAYQYNSFGELEWQQDAKAQVTQQRYDVLGRMTWRTEQDDTVATTWTYDGAAYGKGQIQSVAGKDGYAESYTYNSTGLPASMSVAIRNRGVLETFVTSTEYDAQNRVWKTTRPGGFVTENVYNERGYLTAVRSPRSTTTGDEAFNSAALQNRINEILSLLPSYQSAANNAAQQATQYRSAAEGWATEADLLEQQTLDNMSAADRQYIDAARASAHSYQSYADVMQAQADAYQAIADKYDSYAEFYLLLDSDPAMQASHWVTLAQARHDALAARAAALEATAASFQTSITSYTNLAASYDANADTREAQILASVQAQIGQLEQQASDAFQAAEAKQAEADEAAAQVARLQSQLSMLQANVGDSANITWWRADTVDAEGRITQEVVGNGLLTRRTYDPGTGHLLEIQTGGAGIGSTDNDIQDVGYTYDAADNVEHRWDQNISLHAQYAYDSLDRLTSVQSTHPSIADANYTKTYSYDSAGNLDQHYDNGQAVAYGYQSHNQSSSLGYSTAKRLSSVSDVGNVAYDANGNVTNSGSRILTWDAANYPLSVSDGQSTALYTYGPSRQRLTRVENKSGGWQFQTVYGAAGYERSHIGSPSGSTIEHRYAIHANGRLVANRIATEWAGTTVFRAEYYHEDALNSVEVITDSVGRIMRRFHYDAFGYRHNVTALGFDDGALMRPDNPFNTYMVRGFTGHEHLDELGLIHMNGRVYDTLLRRFLSADPHIQAPLDTQSYNRYSYVKNNPLKYTDPSGFFLKKLFKKIKSFVRQNWRAIVGTALMFIPGGQGFGALLLKGFAANMLLTGGDWKQSALGAFMFAGSGGQLNFTGDSGGSGEFSFLDFGIALMRNIRTYGTGPSQTTRPPDENFRTPLLYTGPSIPAGGMQAARGGGGGAEAVTVGNTGVGPGGEKFKNGGASRSMEDHPSSPIIALRVVMSAIGSGLRSAVGTSILSEGPRIGSALEKGMVEHFFFGNGTDFYLSHSQARRYLRNPTSDEFDFGIGRPAVGSNGRLDRYDFDTQPWGRRSWDAEFATRTAGAIGEAFGGVPFDVFMPPPFTNPP